MNWIECMGLGIAGLGTVIACIGSLIWLSTRYRWLGKTLAAAYFGIPFLFVSWLIGQIICYWMGKP